MKAFKIYFFIIIFSILSVLNLSAQRDGLEGHSVPAKRVMIYSEIANPEDNVDLAFENPDVEDIEQLMEKMEFNMKLSIQLFATGNISKIHVKVGTEPTAGDVAKYTFEFDPDEKELEQPFTYDRSGKTIVLGVGQVTGLKDLFAEVILENEKGVQSVAKYSNDF